MYVRRFETARRSGPRGGDGVRWAFCISTSYWQIAAEGTGEWEREVDRSDPERLPIAAVVSDKNVAGGGGASRVPFLVRLPFTRCLVGNRKY